MKIVTLANLMESTEQEVFDHVVTHARRQKKQSIKEGMCAYRSYENACFAGCLMTDNEYAEANNKAMELHLKCPIERKNIETTTWTSLVDKDIVPHNHYVLIQHLQQIHDKFMVGDWEERFVFVAEQHNLKYTPPN